ncbi:MAG: hypothetical protein KF778_13155 [Rhodocyclaceae bacterium]|nr:hypothetical protein [Rhodocyclaceae bacterium]
MKLLPEPVFQFAPLSVLYLREATSDASVTLTVPSFVTHPRHCHPCH